MNDSLSGPMTCRDEDKESHNEFMTRCLKGEGGGGVSNGATPAQVRLRVTEGVKQGRDRH